MIAAAAVSLLLLIASQFAIERVRDRVDDRRRRETGIGGTHDIALWGMLVAVVLIIVTVTFMCLAILEIRELKKVRGISLSHSELRHPQC